MNDQPYPSQRSPATFFLLVFALTIPLYLVGGLTPVQILPGLPISSLMIIAPLLAAMILVYRENKTAGVAVLLKRSLDFRRVKAKLWYVPVFLLIPGLMALSYGIMRWTGKPVPPPQFSIVTVLVLSFSFLIAGVFEEIGWMGYAIEPLQDRYNAFLAGILLGLVWAVWHFIPLLQADRSWDWIAWWSLNTVAQRVLIVWLFNNTGKSVLAAAITHASYNLSWQLFPISGSYFDPRITGLITALLAVLVVVIWGPRTLTRYRDPLQKIRVSGAQD